MEDSQIKLYLEDEKTLLETWYIKYQMKELGLDKETVLKGSIPSVEQLKQLIEIWISNNYDKLKKIICQDFKYNENKIKYKTSVLLVREITKLLMNDFGDSTEVVSYLLNNGLDALCR